MLTTSAFDKTSRLREQVPDGASALEVGPAIRELLVAPAEVALGTVPAAFREWRAQPVHPRRVMRLPALLGAIAMHVAGVALVLLVEWSLVAPVPLPAITVALNFEPVPQPAISPQSELAPAVASAAAVPDEAPPEKSVPDEPARAPPPPVALTSPETPTTPPEPAPSVEAPPPKPPAVAKIRPQPPPTSQAPRRRTPTPSVPESAPETAIASAPPSAAAAAAPPAVVAAAPIIPPRPVGKADGNREPDYPVLARSRHLQGSVLLRVNVAPSGTPLAVTVATSSGHAILDDAAVAAVKTWRFSPATQAGVPVAAVADVPIRFRMAD